MCKSSCEELPQACRNAGCTDPAHPDGQQRSQHPASVHRECRNQIEYSQHQIGQHQHRDNQQRVCEYRSGTKPVGVGYELIDGVKQKVRTKDECYDKINCRASQGNDQLLNRLFWQMLQHCQPADWQQNDFPSANSIPPGRQGVTKLVQKNTRKQQQHKQAIP